MPSEARATAPTVTAADLRVMGMRVRVSSAARRPRPLAATGLRRQERAAGSLRPIPSEARQDGFHQAENLQVNLEPTPTPAPKATAPTATGRTQRPFFCGIGR